MQSFCPRLTNTKLLIRRRLCARRRNPTWRNRRVRLAGVASGARRGTVQECLERFTGPENRWHFLG